MWEVIAPMIVATTLILTIGAGVVLRGPLGKALADRLTSRRSESREDEIMRQLRDDVDEVRGQLAEMQERLDFAERLLVQQRAGEVPARRLPEGS